MQRQRLFIKFDVTPRRLQLLMQVGNARALEDAGGVPGVATLLQVKLDHGIAMDERLDYFTDRIEKYVDDSQPNLNHMIDCLILFEILSFSNFMIALNVHVLCFDFYSDLA